MVQSLNYENADNFEKLLTYLITPYPKIYAELFHRELVTRNNKKVGFLIWILYDKSIRDMIDLDQAYNASKIFNYFILKKKIIIHTHYSLYI